MSGIPGPPPPCPLCPPVCVLARLGPGATSNVPATTPDLWEMLPGSFKDTPLPRSLLSPSLSPLSLLHLLGTQDHVRTERVTLFALQALAVWTVPFYGQGNRLNEAPDKSARASCSSEEAKPGFHPGPVEPPTGARPPHPHLCGGDAAAGRERDRAPVLCPVSCGPVMLSLGLTAPVKHPLQGYCGVRMGPEGFRDKRLLPPPGPSTS